MKRLLTILFIMILALGMGLCGCASSDDVEEDIAEESTAPATDIEVYDVDGSGINYAFMYHGEEFHAQYYYDNWTLFDSYKITDGSDMEAICQALIDIHPVHGRDMESYREADDMAYEWKQHNLAYKYLPEDNAWRESAQNVDFDPADQGRSFKEIYEDRTGEEFDLEKYIKEGLEDGEAVEKLKEMFGE